LDCVHFTLSLRQLSIVLFIALNKKRRRPENYYSCRGRHGILRGLTVLCSGSCGCCCGYALSLGCKLLAII
jgi:hypothetical protein